MGLKFRLTLKPLTEVQFDAQVQDFCRRVGLQDMFADATQDPDLNPKFQLVGIRRDGTQILRKSSTLLHAQRIAAKHRCEQATLEEQSHQIERIELQELKANPDIRIFLIDKNLGPAVMLDYEQSLFPSLVRRAREKEKR